MKTAHLLLWRHAEAQIGYPDDQRTLTSRGEQQAQRTARWLQDHIPPSTQLLCSPSLRTRQTSQAFSANFTALTALGTQTTWHELLHCCGWSDAYLEQPSSTLIVGHQPTLGQATALLLTGEPSQWSIRKGALWWLTLRQKNGENQIVLRTVIDPDFL